MTVKRQLMNFGKRTVDYRVGAGALSDLSRLVRAAVGKPKRSLIITSSAISDAELESITRSLIDAGFRVDTYDVPAGDSPRTLEDVSRLIDVLAKREMTADDLLLGVGDARVLSLVSAAARLWLGGMQSVLVPTTLDAMVSVSTGMEPLDTGASSGMVMLDPEPTMVVCDTSFVRRRPLDELGLGLVLIVGTYLAESRRQWDHLAELTDGLRRGDAFTIQEALLRTQAARRLILTAANPSARRALDFGQVTARALRACLGDEAPDWQLLAEGMRFEARLAVDASAFTADDVFSLDDRFEDLGIEELGFELDPDVFCRAVRTEQLKRSNRLHLALPKTVGTIRLAAVEDDVLRRHAEAYLASRAELLQEEAAGDEDGASSAESVHGPNGDGDAIADTPVAE